MAYLPEQRKWSPGIYQFEITDPLQSGPDGVDNKPGKDIANRTVFLKGKIDDFLAGYSYSQGGIPRLASTINVSIQDGGLVAVDGVTPVAGDVILLKDQTDPKENGLYIVATGAWGRVPQYANANIGSFDGVMMDIHEGAVNGGKIFMLDALQSYTIGADPLTFRATVFSYAGLPGKVLVHDRMGNFVTRAEEGEYLDAHDFGVPNPTQEDITAYALADIGISDPSQIINQTKVKNLNNNHVWILANTPGTTPPVFWWSDNGEDNTSPASNDSPGMVQGNPGDPAGVTIENGIIKVVTPAQEVALAEMVDGYGRNLMTLLGKTTIIDTIAEIVRLCNNSGQIDASGVPFFHGFRVGDYIDGMDLSAIAAENGGTAGQAWSDTYKNNKIVIGGFNTYKGVGDTENTKNHVLFVFRNIPLKYRMNPANDNTGGYPASDMRAFLEGLNGDGTGDKSGVTTARFLTVLKQQIGNCLYTIRKAHSNKSNQAWGNYTLFLPSELEVYGYPTYGDEGVYLPAITSPAIAARAGWNTNVQFPIFAKSFAHRIKRYNGNRDWWWEQTPYSASAADFCHVTTNGNTNTSNASAVGGCAPAFCVA